MKHLFFILSLTIFVACNDRVNITETKTYYTIDSVQYHGIGQDNTLQTSPYWKLHLKKSNTWIFSKLNYEKNDTIVVIVRKVN